MAITAIVSFNNKTLETVTVTNFENRNNDLTLPPNKVTPCNIWIPWCTSTKDYPHHHIAISGTTPDTAVVPCSIWQDGDHVKYSQPDNYDPKAAPVLGDSSVGGNRQVTIDPSIRFSK